MNEVRSWSRRALLSGFGASATTMVLGPVTAAEPELRGEEARTLAQFKKAYPGMIHGVETKGETRLVIVGEAKERVPLEDGSRGKSFEQRLEAPDLLESMEDSYPLELDRASWPVNHDPGRMRTDSFFRAVYGENERAVRDNLQDVEFCGHRVTFNRRNGAAEALRRVGKKMEVLVAGDKKLQPYVDSIGGTFAWRTVAGTTRLSAHSFAVSIDLNPEIGGYWRWSKAAELGDMKRRREYAGSIVKAFESEKFIWGGKWYHFDLMHFEYRPEFFG